MSIRQIPKGPAFVLGDLFYSNSLLCGGNVRAEQDQLVAPDAALAELLNL